MIVLLAAAIVLGILVLIALIPIGVNVIYSADGLKVNAVICFIKIPVYPKKSAVKRQKKSDSKENTDKKASSKRKNRKTAHLTPNGGKLKLIQDVIHELFPVIFRFFRRIKRKLLINNIELYYQVADTDPFKTAMIFGIGTVALDPVSSALSKFFKIRNKSVLLNYDFTSNEPRVYVNASCSLKIWEIIFIVFALVGGVIRGGLRVYKSDFQRPAQEKKASSSNNTNKVIMLNSSSDIRKAE